MDFYSLDDRVEEGQNCVFLTCAKKKPTCDFAHFLWSCVFMYQLYKMVAGMLQRHKSRFDVTLLATMSTRISIHEQTRTCVGSGDILAQPHNVKRPVWGLRRPVKVGMVSVERWVESPHRDRSERVCVTLGEPLSVNHLVAMVKRNTHSPATRLTITWQ